MLFRLFLIACLAAFVLPASANSDSSKIESLRAKIEAHPIKRLPIIVQFNDVISTTLNYQNSSSKQQRNANATLVYQQQSILDSLNRISFSTTSTSIEGRKVRRFKVSPHMALDVNSIELELLLSEPGISVWEDKLMKPLLSQSVSSVYPTQDESPYHGDNQWAVAILDTGVKTNHSFLAGKLLAEACYSDGGGMIANGTSSLCPGGVTSSIAAGSGQACSSTGCEHGTLVAGVAVGNGNTFDGVARDGKLISIQVYSQIDDLDFCDNGNCLGAYTSDVIAGMERVYELRNTYDIAAVNLSLGSSEVFFGTCDDQPEKAIIDLLKQAGIAVIAASGNTGQTSQMQSPACISSSIAVAATADISSTPWVNNNISSALDIFAPGVDITSSNSNGGFSSATGTSMAAPHVAGAFAVMRHASPNLSVNAAKNLIKSKGPLVTQNTVSRRRLDLSSVLLQIDPSLKTLIPVNFLPPINMLLLDE